VSSTHRRCPSVSQTVVQSVSDCSVSTPVCSGGSVYEVQCPVNTDDVRQLVRQSFSLSVSAVFQRRCAVVVLCMMSSVQYTHRRCQSVCQTVVQSVSESSVSTPVCSGGSVYEVQCPVHTDDVSQSVRQSFSLSVSAVFQCRCAVVVLCTKSSVQYTQTMSVSLSDSRSVCQ